MNLYIVLMYANRPAERPVDVQVTEGNDPLVVNIRIPQTNIRHTFVLATSKHEAEERAVRQAHRHFPQEDGWGNFEAVATEVPRTMMIDRQSVTWHLGSS